MSDIITPIHIDRLTDTTRGKSQAQDNKRKRKKERNETSHKRRNLLNLLISGSVSENPAYRLDRTGV